MEESRESQAQTADEEKREQEEAALQSRMQGIGFKLLVLSGKGGVGKSTVATNLAVALAMRGKNVGLLDVDIHGPSIPKLMGLEGQAVGFDGTTITPVRVHENLQVMSLGFLLQDDNEAVIWRGPRKFGVIHQFLKDVAWGPLDYLVVDSPPGTGDEPLSVAQLVGSPAGAVIVTTPQDLAISDVRRCVTFCNSLSLPVVGIVENMSGLVWPKCGEQIDLFKRGGGEALAREMNIPFLATIPIEPQIVHSGDAGRPFIEHYAKTTSGAAFTEAVGQILAGREPSPLTTETAETGEGDKQMMIAIPLAEGRLTAHFGHCEEFAIVEVAEETKEILNTSTHEPPAHEPGVLPRWLHELGASVIIAGGMGQRAQQLFAENDITVVVGAPVESPDHLVSAYLDGTLQSGANLCDH